MSIFGSLPIIAQRSHPFVERRIPAEWRGHPSVAKLETAAAEGTAPFTSIPAAPRDLSTAEAHNPWRSAVGNPVRFVRLALDPSDAIEELAEQIN